MQESLILNRNGTGNPNEDKLLTLFRWLAGKVKGDNFTGSVTIKVPCNRGGINGSEFEVVWAGKVSL
jgi:hypothetical protein